MHVRLTVVVAPRSRKPYNIPARLEVARSGPGEVAPMAIFLGTYGFDYRDYPL
jgi:hypothetical protein